MARYFIDTNDGNGFLEDDTGLELADDQAARLAAVDALPDIAREVISDGDYRKMAVLVRDAEGQKIYEASLTLKGGWSP